MVVGFKGERDAGNLLLPTPTQFYKGGEVFAVDGIPNYEQLCRKYQILTSLILSVVIYGVYWPWTWGSWKFQKC